MTRLYANGSARARLDWVLGRNRFPPSLHNAHHPYGTCWAFKRQYFSILGFHVHCFRRTPVWVLPGVLLPNR